MKVRLAHKLLLVVAIPVVFQLVFFSVLNGFLTDIARSQEAEKASTEAMILRDRLYVGFYQRVLLYAIYRATNDEKYKNEFDRLDSQVVRDFKSLALLWRDNNQDPGALAGMWNANTQFSMMFRLGMSLEMGDHISDLLCGNQGIDVLRVALDANNSTPAEMLVYEAQQQHARNEKRIAQAYAGISRSLILGLVASVVFSFAGGIFFSTSITTRLKKVLMNIRAMENGSLISPVLNGGGDEIAELDRAISETAKQIREAEEFQSQTRQILAHDLQAPLEDIEGKFEKLKSTGFEDLNAKGTERLQTVGGELNRLQNLVSDLVALDAIRQTGYQINAAEFDLADAVREAIGVVREFAAARQIVIEEHLNRTQVHADRDRVLQVVVNLLSNAIKFSHVGGVVRVRIEPKEGIAKVTVEDDGVGIPDEFQKKVFQKFESRKKEAGSSGLGLAICKKLIEAQSGAMGFSSEEGKGSQFWVELPCKESLRTGSMTPGTPAQVGRPYAPRMTRKAFAVLAAPLMVQLLTIGILWGVVSSSKENLEEIAQTRQVVGLHTEMVRTMVRATFFSLVYNVQQEPEAKESAEAECMQLRDYVRKLTEVSAGDPELAASAKDMSAMITRIIEMDHEVMDSEPNTSVKRWFGPAVAAESEKLLTQTLVPVQKAVEHQNALMEGQALARKEMRESVELVLIVSSIITALVSIALGLYIVKSVNARIERIVSNTVRLKNREALQEPTPGTDELAFVDKAFYDAGQRLLELEQFKQEMISFTSHELRTPLTALQAFVELIEAGVFGAVNDKGSELLLNLKAEIGKLVMMITNLLDAEKMKSGTTLITAKEEIVDEIVDVFVSQLKKIGAANDIRIERLAQGAAVNADAARVVQAMSAIVMDVARGSATEPLVVSTEQADDGVRVKITASSTHDEASDETARRRVAIGLSKLVAEQHGGKFHVHREGTHDVFVFQIPNA